MEINMESLPFVLGIFQSLILIVGINIRTPFKTLQLKTTTFLLLTMMLLMCYYTLYLNEQYWLLQQLNSFGSAAWMALAPVYYLFYRSYAHPSWRFKTQTLLVLLIPFLFFTEGCLQLLNIPFGWYSLINDSLLYLDVWMALFFISGILFSGICVRDQLEFKRQKQGKRILKWFNLILLILYVTYASIYVFIRKDYAFWFECSLVILSEIFVFVLVYRVFAFQSLNKLVDTTKYHSESIPDRQRKEILEQLEKAMTDERLFLDQKLTLGKLSETLSVSQNKLSLLFADHYKTNFYAFVNKYRVMYVAELLKKDDASNYTISALAEMSGFNSKTTFYKVFKETFGCTPSDFIKQQTEDQNKRNAT